MAAYQYDFGVLSEEDDITISNRILTYLEGQTNTSNAQLKGYHDARDGQMGRSILTNASTMITQSEYILVLVSQNSITSGWWEMKAHMSLKHRLDNPQLKDTVIPIYLPGVQSEQRPLELQIIEGLEYDAYVESHFWRQLRNIWAAP